MADTMGKRLREAKKRQQRERKAERKRLRKEGLLGQDHSGLFAPGETHREVVDMHASEPEHLRPVPGSPPVPPAD